MVARRTFALTVLTILSNAAIANAQSVPATAELLSRVPKLASADRANKSISFKAGDSKSDLVALVCWQRDEPLQILVWDSVNGAPFVLLAHDKILLNDPGTQCVWLIGFRSPCLRITKGEGEFKFSFQAGQSEDEEGSKPPLPEPLLVDLPAMASGSLENAVASESSPGMLQLTFPSFIPQTTTTLTFAKRDDHVLQSFAHTSSPESSAVFGEIRINSAKPLKLAMPEPAFLELFVDMRPSRNELKLRDQEAGDTPADAVEKALQVMVDFYKTFSTSYQVRIGLMSPERRKDVAVPRYFDWETGKDYDEVVSPRLWEEILKAQPEHTRRWLEEANPVKSPSP